eukprot:TRINITY_DN16443_c0_g1_i1.p1 TRINITY_DN16443_c0_g1~~TRINITY_DN16443_c0_g1_i1.p1  ORF type:complete len:323 (+),score=32.30 TRINITY_DN16443_c0_g1_i1:76-969(+)
MTKPREITIFSASSSLNLAAKVWGDESSPHKVLAVHGWMDNAATFDGLGLSFIKGGLHVVCLDLPGHGHSDHRPSNPYIHFQDYLPDLISVLDALGWEKASLLGHSMGGALVSFTASLAPNRIIRAVFIEAMGLWSIPPQDLHKVLKESLTIGPILREKGPRVYQTLSQAIDRLQESNGSLSRHAAEAIVRRGTKSTPTPQFPDAVTFRHDIRLRMRPMFVWDEDQVSFFLKEVKCPVLCIFGEKSKHLPLLKKRAHLIEHLDQLVVPDGHHHLHADVPHLVASPIVEFLSKPEEER